MSGDAPRPWPDACPKRETRRVPEEEALRLVPFYWEESKCLDQFTAYPVFFVTVYAYRNRNSLTDQLARGTMLDEWRVAERQHGWRVGRYLILPDRAFFTCSAVAGERVSRMACFVNRWKRWTEYRLQRADEHRDPLWRSGFSSWCLNRRDSCAARWEAVRESPVRYGLAERPGDWPFEGFIGFDEPH